jgi:hypothetical protein
VGDSGTQFVAVATIAAMMTPALLLLGSASLVASALMRMARIVDRARVLAAIVHEGAPGKVGTTTDKLGSWLQSHAQRARYAERSIALLYAAIVVFISACLCIALDRALDGRVSWLPVILAVAGTLLLLSGGVYMVAESRLSGAQISEEIRLALHKLEGPMSSSRRCRDSGGLGRPFSHETSSRGRSRVR